MNCSPYVIVFLACVAGCTSLNILGLATYDGNSHWFVMKSVFEALLNAGHNVTIVSPYTLPPRHNLKTIDTSVILPPRKNAFSYEFLLKEYYEPWRTLHALPNLSLAQCKKTHTLPEVQQLINGPQKYDVVITEIFGADCDAVFSYLLQVPLISVIASANLPWASERVGNPENPAYDAHILLSYAGQLSFAQRLINFGFHLYTSFTMAYYNGVTTAQNRAIFGERVPNVEKVLRNTSLVFVNSHFTVDTPRAFVPNTVEIGGIHLPAVKPLPKDIADILNKSKRGVIYFSLGSIIRASSLPNETINAIRNTFAELECDVLWKYEDENLDVSPNVHVRKWFPQRDIFAHPNVKLVIIHGGLMSVYEAVDQGVPVLGVPLFFDQHKNIMNLVSKGMALRQEIDKITKDRFKENIRKLLDDKKYRENAFQVSAAFHDRVVKPADAVVYWTEYVAKFGGAKHMRSPAIEVPRYQTLLVDILLFVLLSIVALSSVLYVIAKFVLNLISPSHKAILHKNRKHLKKLS